MIRLMPRIRNIHMPANTPFTGLQISHRQFPLRNTMLITQLPTQDGGPLHRGPHPRIKPLLPSVSMPRYTERGMRTPIRANLYTQTMRIRRGMPTNRRLRQALHSLPNITHIMRRTPRRWGSEIVCCRHRPTLTRSRRKPHIRACCMNHNPIHRTIRTGRVMRRRNKPHNMSPPNTTINISNTLPSSCSPMG